MAGQTRFEGISDGEFSNLLQALSASAKGRSFLSEYRRRARPEETGSLLNALGRIEKTIAAVRDQLQPERIADELRRIAMTLEVAAAPAGPDGAPGEVAARAALVERARSELSAFADGLAGKPRPQVIHLGSLPEHAASAEGRRTRSPISYALLRQAAEDSPSER